VCGLDKGLKTPVNADRLGLGVWVGGTGDEHATLF